MTAKWTIVASMLCYSGYILAQFYPSYATLVMQAIQDDPSGFTIGFVDIRTKIVLIILKCNLCFDVNKTLK